MESQLARDTRPPGQDLVAAEQELERLTDWRRYRTYDIMVTNTTLPNSEVSYSRHGMFSGGENKTTIYWCAQQRWPRPCATLVSCWDLPDFSEAWLLERSARTLRRE